ncbi:hypothetical protein DY000_02048543 [Brassica cretica]|uniref:Uncharacterized protein n=1 Tax=Brassica cretica TaxID=69181 RepID=A0ABQ7EP22_BRACR|nr:hypothetical protein DY000_02048543 [Brassica cretica]
MNLKLDGMRAGMSWNASWNELERELERTRAEARAVSFLSGRERELYLSGMQAENGWS